MMTRVLLNSQTTTVRSALGLDATGTEVRRTIHILADRLENHDSYLEELAAEAADADRPAFWITSRYHNQAMGLFGCYANSKAILEEAVADYRRSFPHSNHNPLAIEYLDRLLPLNDAAVEALRVAYAGLGTWRSIHELRLRVERLLNVDADAAGAVEGRRIAFPEAGQFGPVETEAV